MPLSLDAYTLATLSGANGPLFQKPLGFYLNSAPVNMSIQLPAGVLNPALVGLTLHHAALRIDATGLPFVAEASNPLPLTLQP